MPLPQEHRGEEHGGDSCTEQGGAEAVGRHHTAQCVDPDIAEGASLKKRKGESGADNGQEGLDDLPARSGVAHN